jgi:hypothetical protein
MPDVFSSGMWAVIAHDLDPRVGEVAGAPGTSQFGYSLRCPSMTPNAPSSRGRMGRSRLGGVTTALAPLQGSSPRQLALGISSPAAALIREVLLPGAVKIAGWLSRDAQRSLAAGFRQWALPPAGLRHPRVPSGHLMSVQSYAWGGTGSRTSIRERPTTPTAHRSSRYLSSSPIWPGLPSRKLTDRKAQPPTVGAAGAPGSSPAAGLRSRHLWALGWAGHWR